LGAPPRFEVDAEETEEVDVVMEGSCEIGGERVGEEETQGLLT
jgi:hypothetical protein